MEIPTNFKTQIASSFYDKLVKVLNISEVVDDEGWGSTSTSTQKATFYGNVNFGDVELRQEEFGLEENVDIVITCEYDVSMGEVLEYDGVTYKVIKSIEYDSHNLLLGQKWLSKSSTLISA